MHRTSIATAIAAAIAGVVVPAQEPPPPVFCPYLLDSGFLDHPGPGPATVVVGDVQVAGASFLQLWFGDCNLPAGSRLRLLGARDGAVQWFEATSLRDYSFASAFFNGDRVQVALVAGPGTTANRVVVTRVRVGGAAAGEDGICGPTDTRVLSNDPRVGRIDGCCTTYLVDERTLCTAGHCMGGIGGQLVNFNVPLSDPSGNPQFPPPQDQYALLPGSLTTIAAGVGNDWAVMSTVRNSNTGLYAGQAQGSWFVPAVPPLAYTHDVKVTGYGTSAVNPTWSLAQKENSGPRMNPDQIALAYRAHVSGCNSGSPAIHANTGEVLGVVTHAGCLASGLGQNFATGYGRTTFLLALQALQQSRVAGTMTVFGQGCAGGFGVPALALQGTPDLGGSVVVQITGTNPNTNELGLLEFGLSDATWSGGPLPADLGGLGLPGCFLFVRPDAGQPLFTNFGSCAYVLSIPNQPVFLAMRVWCQYFAFDASAANAAQAVNTNAGRITVGN